jgi:hypothetical protein
MRNINLKYSLYLLVGISLLSFFAIVALQKDASLNFIGVLKIIPKVVSIDLLFVAVFSSYLWRWKIFHNWLVPFPNINGTWKGFIQTTWVDPITNERPSPIPAILTIRQSFFKISCVMRTAEMSSRSLIADFVLDKDNQVKKLSYTYDSNPIATVKERSPQHMGTMIFDIIEKPKRKIAGEYWTGRKTTGHIEMIFWKKEKLEFYPKELGTHPVSELRGDNKTK